MSVDELIEVLLEYRAKGKGDYEITIDTDVDGEPYFYNPTAAQIDEKTQQVWIK